MRVVVTRRWPGHGRIRTILLVRETGETVQVSEVGTIGLKINRQNEECNSLGKS